MTELDRENQILAVHATFIHTVVFSLLDASKRPDLETHLNTASNNGWGELVTAIRQIMQGQSDPSILAPLDDEDKVIVVAILRGIQNPESLPKIPEQADPTVAAPAIASLIQGASTGDSNALEMLGSMAGQMANAGGSMARMGATLKRLVDGERDIDQLVEGMDQKARLLIESILKDLNQKNQH